MTKARIREIRQASAANSAHAAIIAELLAEVEGFQRRTRRGEDISKPVAEELPLAAKVNPAKKARGTREEIVAYFGEISLTLDDCDWFMEKMTEHDWKVGGQPVKDWKGRARQWKIMKIFPSQKRNGQSPTTVPAGPAQCKL